MENNREKLKKSFFFYPWIQEIKGSKNSCIYDLKRGILFVLKDKRKNPLLLIKKEFGKYLYINFDSPDLFTSVLKFEIEEKITLILMEDVIELTNKIPLALIERIFIFKKGKKSKRKSILKISKINNVFNGKITQLIYNPKKCPFFREPLQFDTSYLLLKIIIPAGV